MVWGNKIEECHEDEDEENNAKLIYLLKKTQHWMMPTWQKLIIQWIKQWKNHFPSASHSTKVSKMSGLLDKCYGENKAEKMTWDYCEGIVRVGLTQIDTWVRSEGGKRANPTANQSTEYWGRGVRPWGKILTGMWEQDLAGYVAEAKWQKGEL